MLPLNVIARDLVSTYCIKDASGLALRYTEDAWFGSIDRDNETVQIIVAGDSLAPHQDSVSKLQRILPHLDLIEQRARDFLVNEHPSLPEGSEVGRMRLQRLECDTGEDYDFQAIFGVPGQGGPFFSVLFSGIMPIGGGISV